MVKIVALDSLASARFEQKYKGSEITPSDLMDGVYMFTSGKYNPSASSNTRKFQQQAATSGRCTCFDKDKSTESESSSSSKSSSSQAESKPEESSKPADDEHEPSFEEYMDLSFEDELIEEKEWELEGNEVSENNTKYSYKIEDKVASEQKSGIYLVHGGILQCTPYENPEDTRYIRSSSGSKPAVFTVTKRDDNISVKPTYDKYQTPIGTTDDNVFGENYQDFGFCSGMQSECTAQLNKVDAPQIEWMNYAKSKNGKNYLITDSYAVCKASMPSGVAPGIIRVFYDGQNPSIELLEKLYNDFQEHPDILYKIVPLQLMNPTWNFTKANFSITQKGYVDHYYLGIDTYPVGFENEKPNLIKNGSNVVIRYSEEFSLSNTLNDSQHAVLTTLQGKVSMDNGYEFCVRAGLEKYIDPLEYLDERHIYAFLIAKFNVEDLPIAEEIESILENSFFDNFKEGESDDPSKLEGEELERHNEAVAKNNEARKGYAEDVLYACTHEEDGKPRKNTVNPLFLLSNIFGETPAGNKEDANGTKGYGLKGFPNEHDAADEKTYHNLTGEGAYDGSNAVENAKAYAIEKEWFSIRKAMVGACDTFAGWADSSGQGTIYLQRFNLNGSPDDNFHKQYSTDVRAPYVKSEALYARFKKGNTIKGLTFEIPVIEKE